jgi:hypothetical protein
MSTPLSFPLALAPPSQAGLFLPDAKAVKQEGCLDRLALRSQTARCGGWPRPSPADPALALGLVAPYIVPAKQESSPAAVGARVREPPPHQRSVLTY